MNPEEIVQIRTTILTYLADKFQEEFEIKAMYQEFDGKNGIYVRAMCCEKDSDVEFAVYCTENTEESESKTYIIEDKYAEIILQNKIMAELSSCASENVFCACKIDLQQEDSMENAYVKIYIVTDGTPADALRKQAEHLLEAYSPYTGYIYYAEKNAFVLDDIQGTYAENQHDFGNFLVNNDFADRVEFTLYSKNALQNTKVVKE